MGPFTPQYAVDIHSMKTTLTNNISAELSGKGQDSNPLRGKRILHAPFEVAGNMARICKFLQQNNIDAVSANYVETWLDYKCDINLKLNNCSQEEKNQIIDNFAQRAIEEYDIFHFHFGYSLYPDYKDLDVLRKKKKKIVFSFWGSDTRAPEWILYQQAKYLGYDPPKPYFNTFQQYQLLRHLNKYADVMLGTTAIPRGILLRGHVDASLWTMEEKNRLSEVGYIKKDPGRTYFLHAPTSNWKKGTQLIMPVLEELKKRGWPIEIIYVNKLPWPEARKIYAYADYAVDQVGVGSTGMFGMEMMCWGIPVLVYQTPLFAKVKNYPPVIPITKATLVARIAECIEEKQNGKLGERGQLVRKWVLENEDINHTIHEYIDMYKDLANDVSVKQHANPSWYIQEEKILRGVKSDFYQYMNKSGAFNELNGNVSAYDKRLYL